MCGICGILNSDPGRPVERAILIGMNEAMRHRGPDAQGLYLNGPLGLGHRRLSIIDLETGQQPMTNEDESLWLVFNGEIYNFPELRRQLVKAGMRFGPGVILKSFCMPMKNTAAVVWNISMGCSPLLSGINPAASSFWPGIGWESSPSIMPACRKVFSLPRN